MDEEIEIFSKKIGYYLFIFLYLYSWWDILSDTENKYGLDDLEGITFSIFFKVALSTFILYIILKVFIWGNKVCNPRQKSEVITLDFFVFEVFHIFNFFGSAFFAALICLIITKLYSIFFVDQDNDSESYKYIIVRCLMISNIILFILLFSLLKAS